MMNIIIFLGGKMRLNSNRILYILILAFILVSSHYCTKEKWEGRIHQEGRTTVIENKGLGLWGEKTREKISFQEDLSLGKEEGEDHLMFHSALRTAVDSELNIYILDILNHRILKFDKDGHFLWKAGREGQGPGEFQWPHSIALTPDEGIAVLASPFMHYFTKDGIFQRTIRLRESLRDIQFLPDGRMFVNIMTRGRPGVAAEYYSSEGEFQEKFPEEYRYGPEMSPTLGASIGGGYIQFIGERIYLSLPDRYEIREYDLEGNILRKITRNVQLKPPNIEVRFGGRGVSVFPSDSSGPCFLYRGEMLINSLTLVEKIDETKYKSTRFLDFFNQKGQFLGSYELEGNLTLSGIDAEDNFYFVQYDPFPRVIRSKLS
jgi:hypothetical protein